MKTVQIKDPDMSLVIRKPAFCICENKAQFRCAITWQLIKVPLFSLHRYSMIPLLSKAEISSL